MTIPVMPARIVAQYAAPEAIVIVDDPAGEVRVRWRMGRSQPWRCGSCGPQTQTECCHTFSAGLLLSEELLGLVRLPELGPSPTPPAAAGVAQPSPTSIPKPAPPPRRPVPRPSHRPQAPVTPTKGSTS